jgi:hypothetical protein
MVRSKCPSTAFFVKLRGAANKQHENGDILHFITYILCAGG